MTASKCKEVYRGKGGKKCSCALDMYHGGHCRSEDGFEFIVEHTDYGLVYWPDYLGNGPNRYPMNNRAFDDAAAKVLESRRADIEQAEEFMKAMERSLKGR